MKRAGRGGSATIDASHHAHGHLALSPLMLLGLIIVCTVAYYIFSQLQIASTEQFVFDLLQTGIQIQPGMTGQQAQEFLNGQMDQNHTIGAAIGWAVQIALFVTSFSPDSTLLLMHRKFNIDVSESLAKSASTRAKWLKFTLVALIAGDILTDFVYVMQAHVTMSFSGWWPTFQGLTMGVLLIGLLYPVAIMFVTVYAGKFAFMFTDALIDRLKGAS